MTERRTGTIRALIHVILAVTLLMLAIGFAFVGIISLPGIDKAYGHAQPGDSLPFTPPILGALAAAAIAYFVARHFRSRR